MCGLPCFTWNDVNSSWSPLMFLFLGTALSVAKNHVLLHNTAGKQYQPNENIPNAVVSAGTSKKRKRRISMQAKVKKEKECGIVYKKYRGKGGEVSAGKPGPDC